MSYARTGLLGRVLLVTAMLGSSMAGLSAGAASAGAASDPWPVASSFVKVKHVTVTLHLPKHGSTAFSIAGRGNVPSYGVAGVALRVSTSHATGSGSVLVYRSDSKRPDVSTVTFTKGSSRSSDVVVTPGADRQARVADLSGKAVTVTVIIEGFYRAQPQLPVAGTYFIAAPRHLGSPRIGARASVRVLVPAYASLTAVPVAGVLQLTVGATRSGVLTVDGVRAGSFRAHVTTSMLATVPVRPDGTVGIGSSASAKQVVRADLVGYLLEVPAPASAPTAVMAVMSAPHTATVSWQASESDARTPVLHYVVTALSSAGQQTLTTIGAATSQVVSGLADGVDWTFSVYAVTRLGLGLLGRDSAPVRYTDPEAPASPASVSATASAPGTVTVSWAAPASDGGAALTGYTVSGGLRGQVTVAASASSYSWTGLTVGQHYTFAVTASNAAGTSAPVSSATVMVTGAAGSLVTSAVSVDSAGAPPADGLDFVGWPSMSSNARWVVFSSTDPLVSGDSNAVADVFLRDTQTGTTTRVSSALGGSAGDAASESGSVSADGRYVVFTSAATNLVSGDTNGQTDVFLRDRSNGTTTRISVSTAGVQSDESSLQPEISADGKYVVFDSNATNLVTSETNNSYNVYLRDLVHGTTVRVSRTPSGGLPSDMSLAPSISGDGQYIGYESFADGIVAGDNNGAVDAFRYDTTTSTTTRVSVSATGGQLDADSDAPSMSSDGRYVLFGSRADHVTADGATGYNLYERDMQTGSVVLVSKTTTGGLADNVTYGGSVSDDGSRVLFASSADNLVAGDTNNSDDVFVRYLATGETVRVSVGPTEGQLAAPNAEAWALSADGLTALFAASGSDVDPGVSTGPALAYERTLG